jgi:hypothetical protein
MFQQCADTVEIMKPCEAHQNKFPYAKKECSILYSDVFAPCRNVVSEFFSKLSAVKRYCCIYNIQMSGKMVELLVGFSGVLFSHCWGPICKYFSIEEMHLVDLLSCLL